MAMTLGASATVGGRLARLRAEQNVPGVSAAVVRDGKTVFTGGDGVADLRTGRPMTGEAVLYMGSLSKILTAILALRLIATGRLDLQARVAELLGIGGLPGVTVEHLLRHRSGLPREGDFDYWFSGRFPGTPGLKSYLERAQLRFEPGNRALYSNVGYATVGLVIEAAAADSYAALLSEEVLIPLGMDRSGLGKGAELVAPGYTPRGRVLPNDKRPFAGVGEAILDRRERSYHDARAMSPAFGVYSCAADLARLLEFLLGAEGTKVLSSGTRERMRPQGSTGWGYALKARQVDGRRLLSHAGWFAAHRSHLLLDPVRRAGVAVLANADDAEPEAIALALMP